MTLKQQGTLQDILSLARNFASDYCRPASLENADLSELTDFPARKISSEEDRFLTFIEKIDSLIGDVVDFKE